MGGCASAFQSLSRDDAEGGPPFETVDAEVFAVSGKDDGGPKILCKYDERRVGKVHGEIRVLFEKTTSAFQGRWCGWHEDGSSLEKETDRSRRTAVNRPEEVGGIREYRLGRDHGRLPAFEEVPAPPMMRLAPIEERHQRPGVEQQFTGHVVSVPPGHNRGDVQRGLVRRTRVSQSDGERAPPAAQRPVLRVGGTAAVRA